MISVIIASYNHQDYIEEALESVLQDDFSDKEIVIIDDGSKDNSHKIITSWIQKNKDKIKVTYKHRANKGLTATLNELISMANGEYIVLLDSDDYLLKGGLQKRYEYMQKHPEKMMLFSDAVLVDSKSNKLYDSMLFDFRGYTKEQFRDENIIDTFLKRFTLAGAIYMVRKEFYDEIGGYDETLFAGDMDFFVRAMSVKKVGFLDEVLSAYRTHDTNNSMAGISPKLLRDSARSLVKNMRLFPLKYKPLILWNIIKFLIREQLLYCRIFLEKFKG